MPVCIPQVALANNEYGWALVYGKGRVRTDGGVAAASGFGLSGTNEELDSASAGAETIAGMVALKADDANDGEVFLQFPAVSTDTFVRSVPNEHKQRSRLHPAGQRRGVRRVLQMPRRWP